MELDLSCEVVSLSSTKKFPSILWNPKVHCRVYKSPPVISLLNQINPVHTITSYFCKPISIYCSYLRLGLSSGPFPSVFPAKTLHVFLFSFVLHTTLIISSLTWSFFGSCDAAIRLQDWNVYHYAVISPLFESDIFIGTLFSNTPVYGLPVMS
jgi:hypothetical protein